MDKKYNQGKNQNYPSQNYNNYNQDDLTNQQNYSNQNYENYENQQGLNQQYQNYNNYNEQQNYSGNFDRLLTNRSTACFLTEIKSLKWYNISIQRRF